MNVKLNSTQRATDSSTKVPGWCLVIFFVGVLGCVIHVKTALSQEEFVDIRVAGMADSDQQNATTPGAILNTDPDLETSLATAERFKDDGNYRVASQLYQAVLERSGDALFSADDEIYFSLASRVELALAQFPPEGLTAYRVIADAEAKKIMALGQGSDDVTALNQIVNQYFISSVGDDAAFQLGCIYLDQYDFVGASRLFQKIIDRYPTPSVPRSEILPRLALCQSYLGQLDIAKKTLDQAVKSSADKSSIGQLQSSLGELHTRALPSISEAKWHGSLGNSRRNGVMPSLPTGFLDGDLVAAWQYYFEPEEKYSWSDARGRAMVGSTSGDKVQKTINANEDKLITNWKNKGWRPAGQLLLDGDRVYFKSAADIIAWDSGKISQLLGNGDRETDVAQATSWRSVWRNHFEVDVATRMIQAVRSRYGGFANQNQKLMDNSPESTIEVQLFGDAIHQQTSLVGGIVYSIEGKPFNDKNSIRPSSTTASFFNPSMRRDRENFLTAYDSKTGMVRWTLPKVPDAEKTGDVVGTEIQETPWLQNGGFMSAPVGYGDWILVPVSVNGSLSVYALDPADEGKTVWKALLCDERGQGAVAWSPIQMTIDGSSLFVNTGMGVVFVLDPATGRVQFAKRYQRSSLPADPNQQRQRMRINHVNFDGWSSDIVIPHGRQMVCFSSDSNRIRAIDRNTGKLVWESSLSPIGYKVDYLLGVYNGMLYAAGAETIIAYDLNGEGRMVWGAMSLFDGKKSLGRGVLTPGGIYMPVEDTIYHFELPSTDNNSQVDTPIAKVQVDLGLDAPLGNLYSDGKRLWALGGNRLFALAPKP